MEEQLSGRLPETARPRSYEIRLRIFPEERRFKGEVMIDLEIEKACDSLLLHALELGIEGPNLIQNGRTLHARHTLDPEAETLSLAFSEELTLGPGRVRIGFSGSLNPQLRGLYESHQNGETYAFTQFEPTDARRMFPCFDEPGLKARFRLILTIPAHLTAISNMPAVSEDREAGWKTVTFGETPLMSTYLLALAVARMESKEVEVAGTRVAVWTLPGQLDLGTFALEVTAAVLPLLNEYFDLPYPYPKLDLVSAPDFAMGAMENWGAIFFRDSRLLIDQAQSSTATQRAVANVITHEIVHQWFGNLVTMQWWDDLWLNESFATWLACKMVDAWRPEWNSWAEFQQEKEVPLVIDALESTRPIHTAASNAAQIEQMFDPLSYEKGAACLRMIERFLGEGAFREGIRRYIRKFQYANALQSDLWAELEAASGQPVVRMAHFWFTNPGFPLVTVKAEGPDFDRFALNQQRFHSTGIPPQSSPDIWSVPLKIKYRRGGQIQFHQFVFEDRARTVALPGQGRTEWVVMNAGEEGFLRTQYDPALRRALRPVVRQSLEPVERIGLINHHWALTMSGNLPLDEFLDLLSWFQGDQTRVVLESMVGCLQVLLDQLVRPEDRPRFFRLIRQLFQPVWEELTWDPKPGEDEERRLARAATLWALGGLAEDEDILPETPRRLTLYWVRPGSLDPTLATPLIRICARTDLGILFDKFVQKFVSASTPEERDRYLFGLAEFRKSDLAHKLLKMSLSEGIRSQDVWKPVKYLLANPSSQEETWRFIQENWAAFCRKGGTVGAQRIIQGMQHLWRPAWREEVRNFFQDPGNRVAAAERALAQTLELIEVGVRFKERCAQDFSAWLNAHIAES